MENENLWLTGDAMKMMQTSRKRNDCSSWDFEKPELKEPKLEEGYQN